MCGIAGVLSNSSLLDITKCLSIAENMQKHRGPDIQDQKIIRLGDWSLGFAHQRLSVLDISQAGSQPMSSMAEKSCIIYNGEVYNYLELKTQLKHKNFESSTDTEVILYALEEWGIDNALQRFNGMWAFSWFDSINQKLYICRDRAGIKPLYYYCKNNTLYFSSEVKTILEVTGERFTLNHQAVGEYLFQSLQDSHNNTFYNEIKSVPSAHYIEIDLAKTELTWRMVKYWDVLSSPSYEGNNLVEHVKSLFDDAVKIRMRSDVPVGVTLSGGLDSSSIAATMKKHLVNTDNLHIISAVSPNSELDESKFIDIMADSLKAKIHKVNLQWDANEAIDLLKKTIWHNDAPVGSFSNVAHYLLMKKANELGITVILSGQGADELLCGYKKYLGFYLQSLFREKKIIRGLFVLLGFLFNRTIISQFNFKEAKRYLPKRFRNKDIDISGACLKQTYTPRLLGLVDQQSVKQRQAVDLTQFSVPFLTHYEDRMSMAWSREVRLPFLDYRLMELFIGLPIKNKLNRGWTKFIFRQAMDGILPKKITWRKDKQGFANPQEKWLKNELYNTIINYFNKDALIFKLGLIDRDLLLEKYRLYCSNSSQGNQIWYRDIFNPLSLEIWLQLNQKYLVCYE